MSKAKELVTIIGPMVAGGLVAMFAVGLLTWGCLLGGVLADAAIVAVLAVAVAVAEFLRDEISAYLAARAVGRAVE